MAQKFTLVPDATFTAKVAIHSPGKKVDPVLFTFRHLSIEERQEIDKETKERAKAIMHKHGMPDDLAKALEEKSLDMDAFTECQVEIRAGRPEQLMKFVSGWDLKDAFDLDNVTQLLSYFPNAFEAVMAVFREELEGAKTKN